MHSTISLAVLLPLLGLAHAAMEPSMDNLTVDFFTVNGGGNFGVPADGTGEGALGVRAGTEQRLTGTYTLLVFDSDRCSEGAALCTMQSNLTSASQSTLVNAKMVHELMQSSSRESYIMELPGSAESEDGSMRLLFNTTDNPAPGTAAELLSAPWSSERIVAGSEDKKPTKTRCRKKKRCRARPTSTSGRNGNSTLNLFNSDGRNENLGAALERTALGCIVAAVAMLIVA